MEDKDLVTFILDPSGGVRVLRHPKAFRLDKDQYDALAYLLEVEAKNVRKFYKCKPIEG